MKINTKPETQTFVLKSDPDGKASITVRQARTGDNIELAKLFDEQSRVWGEDDNRVELKQRWNYELIKRKRAFRTLAGATELLDEDGNELFRFREGKNGPELAMSEDSFNRVWGILPPEVTTEISEYVLVVNPQWNPFLVGEA